jgi:hypothetical protein
LFSGRRNGGIASVKIGIPDLGGQAWKSCSPGCKAFVAATLGQCPLLPRPTISEFSWEVHLHAKELQVTFGLPVLDLTVLKVKVKVALRGLFRTAA